MFVSGFQYLSAIELYEENVSLYGKFSLNIFACIKCYVKE